MGNKVSRHELLFVEADPGTTAQKINARPITVQVAGAAAGAYLAIPDNIEKVVCIQAYVTATGAPATKALLVTTTDFVIEANGGVNKIKCVTNQAANTLVVTYIPGA